MDDSSIKDNRRKELVSMDFDCSKGILEEVFVVEVTVAKPILIGQDDAVGRRQLIPILSGTLKGPGMNGTLLPGGVDSQVIRPDGKCELSARYAVQLDDGSSIYIENNGMRTVPDEYVADVLAGNFIDPSLYYFCTVPTFEVYDEKHTWLTNNVFICRAMRTPETVQVHFFQVNQ